MIKRRLGNSDINVSAFSLGSWNTFEFMPEDEGLKVMKAAVDQGITFLDDARYDDVTGEAPLQTGYSEVVFGNLLRKGGFKRDDLFISNRLWFEFYPGQSVEEEVDASLQRIGIDHFDLVFCFDIPKDLSAEALVDELAALCQTGKVKYWAPGNWSGEFLAECCAVAKRKNLPLPPAAMVPYSVCMKSLVEPLAIKTLYEEYDIGLVASFSLFGGILSGKYNDPEAASRRFNADQLQSLREQGTFEAVDKLSSMAKELSCTPAQLSYAFALANPLVSSVLFGATRTQQIEDNVKALEIVEKLDRESLNQLRGLFPEDVRLGH